MTDKLTAWLNENPVFNGFLISTPENIYHWSGFSGSFGFLCWLSTGQKYLVTDGRYAETAAQLARKHDFEFIKFEPNFAEKLTTKIHGKIAGEDRLTLAELARFEKYFPSAEIIPQPSLLEDLRRVKTSDEIKKITAAQHHVDTVLISFLKENLQAGTSEQALNFRLQQVLQAEGRYGLSFPSIIAFGENSSRPHHTSGTRKLQLGDNILIDCGVTDDHYCSDMTRNFVFGQANPDYVQKYQHLLRAQEATHQQIKPGASTQEIDAFCRTELGTDAEFFTHSLGHGVGLEIHELPTLSPRKDYTLQAGEVITNEPGLYYPDQFGIRIEDLVLVTKTGADILSQTSRDLLSFDEAGQVQTLVKAG